MLFLFFPLIIISVIMPSCLYNFLSKAMITISLQLQATPTVCALTDHWLTGSSHGINTNILSCSSKGRRLCGKKKILGNFIKMLKIRPNCAMVVWHLRQYFFPRSSYNWLYNHIQPFTLSSFELNVLWPPLMSLSLLAAFLGTKNQPYCRVNCYTILVLQHPSRDKMGWGSDNSSNTNQ